MIQDLEVSHGKSISELWLEAFWFVFHSALAVLFLFAAIAAYSATHPSAEDSTPKLIGTALAFFVPMVGGFIIAKWRQNDIARYVWSAGIILFAIVCVWVVDLPTGNGLCEHCDAGQKLWRTFFDINHGSGLMGGAGLMIGTWIPLSLFGYSTGASAGLD